MTETTVAKLSGRFSNQICQILITCKDLDSFTTASLGATIPRFEAFVFFSSWFGCSIQKLDGRFFFTDGSFSLCNAVMKDRKSEMDKLIYMKAIVIYPFHSFYLSSINRKKNEII